MSRILKHSQTILFGLKVLGSTSIILYHWYCLRQRLLRKQKEAEELRQLEEEENQAPGYLVPKKHWNTALFFPNAMYMEEDSSIHKLIWYMQQSQTMLKICVYVSTFAFVEKAVYEIIEKKGIRVLGISNVPNTVHRWKKHGIMAREKPKSLRSAFSEDVFVDLMHNKFIIIDDKAVIGGSLNWTKSAVAENRENVIITTHSNIVPKYVEEFERIWVLSEPDSVNSIAENCPEADQDQQMNQLWRQGNNRGRE